MNTNTELDRIVEGFLEDRVAAPPRPDVLRDAIKHVSVTPQARRRFLGRWLDRDEGAGRRTTEHDQPPNTNRRTRLMLSATGITAVLAIIALSVNVFDADPTVPGQAGTTHVVAADGTGDFATIQDAVDAAADGDTISITPGRYEGTVTIDRDITLRGDGPRDQIVVVAPSGEATAADDLEEAGRPHGLLIDGSTAKVSDLTVEVSPDSTGIGSIGGSPSIERVTLINTGPEPVDEWDDSYYALGFYGAGEPTIRDSEWNGYVAVRGGADALFEGNTISSDGISVDGPATSVVRDNSFRDGGWVNSTGAAITVEGNDFAAGRVSLDSQATGEVRDNVFRDHSTDWPEGAISLYDLGTEALVEDNKVSRADNGIWVTEGATADIRGNVLDAHRIGIHLGHGVGATVRGNTIGGEGAGILITRGSDASVTGNTVDVAARGIAISAGSSPTVSGNDVCGEMESIWVHDSATPELSDNKVC